VLSCATWEAKLQPSQRLYLSSSLHNVCNIVLQHALPHNQTQGTGRDAVYSTHLQLLLDNTHPHPLLAPKKILKLARQYSVASTNADVWVRRLETEQEVVSHISSEPSSPDALREVARLARSCCRGEGIESVWTWGWDDLSISQREVSSCTLCYR